MLMVGFWVVAGDDIWSEKTKKKRRVWVLFFWVVGRPEVTWFAGGFQSAVRGETERRSAEGGAAVGFRRRWWCATVCGCYCRRRQWREKRKEGGGATEVEDEREE
ncbi:hypothetical protein HAX54_005281 [Datura stramonium]|uniref:Uncharacterized protein n=1 Tax=Datura stramonium TaxID=4076 RepID=A0ABS8Y746_DATST|nr:hypothetical protein [Datura stramonium]